MKKSKLIIASFLLLINIKVIAQETTEPSTSRMEVGVFGAYSNLMGNATNSDYADTTAGFASSSGFSIGLQGNYQVKKNIGIAFQIASSSFRSAGLKNMADGYLEDFEVDQLAVTASGTYQLTNFLLGPNYRFSLTDKLHSDICLLAGVVYASSPEYKVEIEEEAASTFYQHSSNAFAFGLQVGASISYQFAPQWSANLLARYFYTRPDFEIENENRKNNVGRKLTTYNQAMSGVHTALGLTFHL